MPTSPGSTIRNDSEYLKACTSGESLELAASACVSFLSQYWQAGSEQTLSLNGTDFNDSEHSEASRVIVLALDTDCSLERVENDLKDLLHLAFLASPACAEIFPFVLCRHIYRPCSGNLSVTPWTAVGSDECRYLQQQACKREWELVKILPNSCIALPDCSDVPNVRSGPAPQITAVMFSKWT